jgi:membrane-associated phospholipid phosphatase
MKNAIEEIILNIGYHGPLLLLIINIFVLRNQYSYILIYLTGWLLNVFIVKLLKVIIREKRPNIKNAEIGFEKLMVEEEFGMPSGHAQTSFFSVIFLFLIHGSYEVLYISLFITGLTLYQRFHSRAHSISQLLVGSVLGSGFAWFVYSLMLQSIHS